MRIRLLACAMLLLTGCAIAPSETSFNATLDRAYSVDCDIKSLEWTERRTRLECFN